MIRTKLKLAGEGAPPRADQVHEGGAQPRPGAQDGPALRQALHGDKLLSRNFLFGAKFEFQFVKGQRRLLLQRPQQPRREAAQQHGLGREQGLHRQPHHQRLSGQQTV